MTCCGSGLSLYRNSDLRITYVFPRGYNMSGFSPTFFFRAAPGGTPLLTVTQTATSNGSSTSTSENSVVLTLKRQDIVTSFPNQEIWEGFYDSTLTEGGFVNRFVGGSVITYADGSYDEAGFNESVFIEISGAQVPVVVQGGNVSVGASVLLADLNAAVESAAQSATDAEAAAAGAESIAAVKLDRDGGNPEPGLLDNIGAAAVDLTNVDFQRSSSGALDKPILQLLNALDPQIEQFGGVGGDTSITGAVTTTAGFPTVTVAGASFTDALVGKLVSVPRALTGGGYGLTLLARVTAVLNPTTFAVSVTPTVGLAGVSVTVTFATDDTAALQAMIDGTLPGLAPCRLSRTYHITGPVYVRGWRVLQGSVSVGQILNRTSFKTKNGIIVLWPGAKLVPLNGARFDGLTIGGADAMINPPVAGSGMAEALDAYSRINAWTGTAIEATAVDQTGAGTRDGAMDVEVNDCSIIGMNKAIRMDNIARWSFRNLKVDCLNGLEFSNTYDTGRVLNLHIWGFWNGNYGHGAAYPLADTRPGKGVYLHTGIDGCLFNTALIFGMKEGVVVQGEPVVTPDPGRLSGGVYACQFVNYWVDNVSETAASRGTSGIKTLGECRLTKFVATHVDAQDNNWNLGHKNDTVGITMSACSSGLANSSLIKINSGSGVIDGFQMGGSSNLAAVLFGTNHGQWLIDNVLAEDLGSAVLFNQADPLMRRKVSIGAVRTRNAPAFNRNVWMSFVKVSKTANQTIPADTNTNVSFVYGSDGVDGFGEFDLGTGAYYAANAGVKTVNVAVDFKSASATLSGVEIYLVDQTGNPVTTIATGLTTDVFSRVYSGSWTAYVNAGDVLFIRIHSTVGGTVSTGQTRLVITDRGGA